ncbi:hypothetical protein G5I_01946 [Acromyrmex echinatior]|uniref:Uncharacterized protein n=1 Tax=Acromyrmex echinatior TaxID=103372 RepID=F4W900_ACREC|nr:hypothetical protein G5I_01946 [Acromyrmex echinatior]
MSFSRKEKRQGSAQLDCKANRAPGGKIHCGMRWDALGCVGIAVTRHMNVRDMGRRKEQPVEIIALIVAERISSAARLRMTLESFVDCEREDEPRWRIISDSRCLALAFLATVAKSLRGNSCMGNGREKAGLRRRKNEEKRSEKEDKKRSAELSKMASLLTKKKRGGEGRIQPV